MRELVVKACERTFVIECGDAAAVEMVLAGFGEMLAGTPATGASTRVCHVHSRRIGPRFRVAGAGRSPHAADVDDVVFHVDKRLTIALQRQRSDLYFLHAAAVALDGRAVVLAAPPGTGKSTLTLALLTAGFTYLSDELAPVDAGHLLVHPYTHALCLKSRPPHPFRLPPAAIPAGARYHIPAAALPATSAKAAQPLAAIVFVQRSVRPTFTWRPISAARAAARLIENALNPLAHQGCGLDAAVTLSRSVPCFELETGSLVPACDAVFAMIGGRVDAGASQECGADVAIATAPPAGADAACPATHRRA